MVYKIYARMRSGDPNASTSLQTMVSIASAADPLAASSQWTSIRDDLRSENISDSDIESNKDKDHCHD